MVELKNKNPLKPPLKFTSVSLLIQVRQALPKDTEGKKYRILVLTKG